MHILIWVLLLHRRESLKFKLKVGKNLTRVHTLINKHKCILTALTNIVHQVSLILTTITTPDHHTGTHPTNLTMIKTHIKQSPPDSKPLSVDTLTQHHILNQLQTHAIQSTIHRTKLPLSP